MLARAALGAATASVAVTGLTFVSGVVIARSLGPEDRGLLGLVFFWPSFILALLQFPWTETLVIGLSNRRGPEDADFRAALIGWGWRTAFRIALLTWPLLVVTVVIGLGGQPWPMVLLSLGFGTIGLFCGSFSRVQIGILQSEAKFQVLNASTLVLPLTYAGLSLCVAAIGLGLPGFVGAQSLAHVTAYFQRNYCIRHVRMTSDPLPETRQVAITGMSIMGLTLLSSLCGQADRLLFMPTSGAAEIGIYLMAFSLAGPLQGMLSTALMSVTLPALAALDGMDKQIAAIRVLRLTIAASIIATLATVAFAPLVLPLLLGPAFREAGPLASFIALATATIPVAQVLNQILLSANKKGGILAGQIAFLLVILALFTALRFMSVPWAIVPALGLAHLAQALVLGAAFHKVFPAAPLSWIVPKPETFAELYGIFVNLLRRRAGIDYGRA